MGKSRKKAPSQGWPTGFTSKDCAMFEHIGVPAELVIEAGVRRVSDGEARHFGISGKGDMAGLLFPYLDLRTGKIVTSRVRRDHPELKSGKPDAKYMTPRSDHAKRVFYFPPGAKEKLQDRADVLIVLVEAEKSALALTAWAERIKQGDRVLPVAMGGCWGWSQAKEPLPDFDLFEGRTVFVLLDANVMTNAQVRGAHDALVSALCGRQCAVYTLSIPQLEGVNGPDDLLAQPNGDALMVEVLNRSRAAVVAPYSDDALATQFADEQKDVLRYVHSLSEWLLWDGKRWKADDTQAVGRRVQDFCLAAATRCGKLAEARRIRSSKTIDAVQREASKKAQLISTVEQWDSDPMLLGTPDGVVDLRTGQLRSMRREDYITKLSAVAPRAGQPVRWLKFLDEVTDGVRDLQAYLQRVSGYCLTGDTSEHALLFLYGTGANGKSVFVSTLLGMLGDYARVASMETFMATHNAQHSTDLAGLRGARIVTATETEEGSRWAEAKLKAITGGERIAARKMRQDFIEFTPQFKLLLSGNHRPRLRNVDEAMRRRLHLVPFVVTVPEKMRDPELAKNLRAEWPGILHWAMEGCLEWRRRGLSPPSSVTLATQDYLEGQDVLGQWLVEATVAVKNPVTKPNELHTAYLRWAELNHEYMYPHNQFAQKLAERGYPSTKSHGERRVALKLQSSEGESYVGAGRKFDSKN